MNAHVAASMALGFMVALGNLAHAQCTKDTDCKFQRVCEQGQCISADAPAVAPAPGDPNTFELSRAAAPQTTPLSDPGQWFRGYGSIGPVIHFQSWGKFTVESNDVDITLGVSPGVHLSGYYVINDNLHLGGYFSHLAGEVTVSVEGYEAEGDVGLTQFGGSFKLGGQISPRIWIGYAMDLGFLIADVEGADKNLLGVSLFPRFHLDAKIVDAQGFKMGLFAALGASVIPYAGREINDQHGWIWSIGPTMALGLTLGG